MSSFDATRLPALRARLAQASAEAAHGRLAQAHAAYAAVRGELAGADLGDRRDEIEAAFLRAQAFAGIAWVASRQDDLDKAQALAHSTQARVNEVVESCRRAGLGGLLFARVLELRAQTALDLGDPGAAFDDLLEAEAEAEAESSAAVDADFSAHVGRAIAVAAAAMSRCGLTVPSRCGRCSRTARTVSILLRRNGAALCAPCVLEIAKGVDTLPERVEATCAFCASGAARARAVTPTLAACRPCLEGMAWALTTDGHRELCASCGRAGEDAGTLVAGGATHLCAGCVQRLVAELERICPRVSARRRRDAPRAHPGRLCACCGTHHGRVFVELPDERPVCDACVDRCEARLSAAGDLDAAAESDETAPAPHGELEVETLEAIAAEMPEIATEVAVVLAARLPDAASVRRWLERLTGDASQLRAAAGLHHALALFHGGTPEAVVALDAAIAAARRAAARGEPVTAIEIDASLRRASRFAYDDDRPDALELLGEALCALAIDRSAATVHRLARVMRRLGDSYPSNRKPEQQVAYDRAIALLEPGHQRRQDEHSRELAASLVNLANVGLPGSEALYARGADIFERYLRSDASGLRDFTIALENRSMLLVNRGALDEASDDLQRALDAAIGGARVHGSQLDARVGELDQALVKVLEKSKRWRKLADAATAAAERCEERGDDATALRATRKTALQQAQPPAAPYLRFCTSCDAADTERDFVVEGRAAAVCDACLDVADESPADDDASPCGMCGEKEPQGGFALAKLRVCATCVTRARRKLSELEGAERNVGWIGDDVPRLQCSFCSKPSIEVKKLIAGPDQHLVCDECIGLCNDIIDEDSEKTTKPSATFGGPTCSFCGKSSGWKLIAGPDVAICDACIDSCNEIIAAEAEEVEA